VIIRSDLRGHSAVGFISQAAELEVERMRLELEDSEKRNVKLNGATRAREEDLRDTVAKARQDNTYLVRIVRVGSMLRRNPPPCVH